MRTLLEKLRPIDEKLRYRVEKLLASQAARAMPEEAEFRPQVEGMMTSITDDVDEEEVKADGVYKPPRISSVEYTGDHLAAAEKAQKALDRQSARLRKSDMVRSLREEFTDAPQEIQGELVLDKGIRALERKRSDRETYEEENMIRLSATKQDKRDMKRLRASKFAGRSGGAVSLQDFADVSGISSDLVTEGNRRGSALAGFKAAQKRAQEAQDVVRRVSEGKVGHGADGHWKKRNEGQVGHGADGHKKKRKMQRFS